MSGTLWCRGGSCWPRTVLCWRGHTLEWSLRGRRSRLTSARVRSCDESSGSGVNGDECEPLGGRVRSIDAPFATGWSFAPFSPGRHACLPGVSKTVSRLRGMPRAIQSARGRGAGTLCLAVGTCLVGPSETVSNLPGCRGRSGAHVRSIKASWLGTDASRRSFFVLQPREPCVDLSPAPA